MIFWIFWNFWIFWIFQNFLNFLNFPNFSPIFWFVADFFNSFLDKTQQIYIIAITKIAESMNNCRVFDIFWETENGKTPPIDSPANVNLNNFELVSFCKTMQCHFWNHFFFRERPKSKSFWFSFCNSYRKWRLLRHGSLQAYFREIFCHGLGISEFI